MKKSIRNLALALCAALALTGCGKSEGEKKADTNKAAAAKKVADTPKAIAGAWSKAVLAGKYTEADSYLSKEFIKLAKERNEKLESPSEAIAADFKKLDNIPADVSAKEKKAIEELQAEKKDFEKLGEGVEKIEGDKATVTSGKITVLFVKEDGKWKIWPGV